MYVDEYAFNVYRARVKVGTTVRWVNNGKMNHTITADDGSWSTPRLSPLEAGAVTFDMAKPSVEKLPPGNDNAAFSGKATTNVKFGESGDYVLHVIANDYSGDGGGGFQCCWTTGLVKVSVKP